MRKWSEKGFARDVLRSFTQGTLLPVLFLHLSTSLAIGSLVAQWHCFLCTGAWALPENSCPPQRWKVNLNQWQWWCGCTMVERQQATRLSLCALPPQGSLPVSWCHLTVCLPYLTAFIFLKKMLDGAFALEISSECGNVQRKKKSCTALLRGWFWKEKHHDTKGTDCLTTCDADGG